MSERSYFHSEPAPEGRFTARHVGWVEFGKDECDGFALGFKPEKPQLIYPDLYYTDDDMRGHDDSLDHLLERKELILTFSRGIDRIEPFETDIRGLRIHITRRTMLKNVPGLYGHYATLKAPPPARHHCHPESR